MKIILKQEIADLGDLGDELDVKPGYARNFLLPQGLAIQSNLGNQKWANRLKEQIMLKRRKLLEDLQFIATKIEALQLEFTAKAGENGKLFGSITTRQINEALIQNGLELNSRQLKNLEPLKQLGEHQVRLGLHTECSATLLVKVIGEQPELPPETADPVDSESADSEVAKLESADSEVVASETTPPDTPTENPEELLAEPKAALQNEQTAPTE